MAPSHYLNQCCNIINWTLGNKLQWNLNRNFHIFIQENKFENIIRKLVAILSQPMNKTSLTIVLSAINTCILPVSRELEVLYHPATGSRTLDCVTKTHPVSSPNLFKSVFITSITFYHKQHLAAMLLVPEQRFTVTWHCHMAFKL